MNVYNKNCNFCLKQKDSLIDLKVSYWKQIRSQELLQFCIPELVHKLEDNNSIFVCQTCNQHLVTYCLFKNKCITNCLKMYNSIDTSAKYQHNLIEKINQMLYKSNDQNKNFSKDSQTININAEQLINANVEEKQSYKIKEEIIEIDTDNNSARDTILSTNVSNIKVEQEMTKLEKMLLNTIETEVTDLHAITEDARKIKSEESNDGLSNQTGENFIHKDEKLIMDIENNIESLPEIESNEDKEKLYDILIENESEKMQKLIDESLKEKNPTCPFCKKKFINKTYYKQKHILFHTKINVECLICGEIVEQQSLAKHKRLHSKEKCEEEAHVESATCPVSFKEIKNKGNLTSHVKINTKDRPYICSLCNKTYTYPKDLRRHLKVVHNPNISYRCTICSKEFKRKDHLKLHMTCHENGHNACSKCGKVFKRKLLLKIHLRTHNQKNQKCSICSNTFTRREYLLRHMITHKKEKPYKCSKCSCTFKSKDYLRNHIKRHHK